jgi:SAM-dependent methyltransferase
VSLPPPAPLPRSADDTEPASQSTDAEIRKRRSRRTLKIPDDAVPQATPAPPPVMSVPAGVESAVAQFKAGETELLLDVGREPSGARLRSSWLPDEPIAGVDTDGESVVMVRPVTLVDEEERSGVAPPDVSSARASLQQAASTAPNETRVSKPPPPPLEARAPDTAHELIEEVEPESDPAVHTRETPAPEVEVELETEADDVAPIAAREAQTSDVEVELEVDDVAPVASKRPPPPPPRARPADATQNGPAARAPQLSQPEAPVTRRQKPWWEELFGDDFVHTMDRLAPKFVQRDVDFIEGSLGVEQGAVILDLACGGGQHAVELARRGYSVVGHDLSLAMLARAADEAQEHGQKLNFLHGDMRELAFDAMFDGVYCWDTSFGYFDEERNGDVLTRIHRALRPGGMLLLDLANRDYVTPRSPSVVWFEGDGCRCMDDMHVDFFASRLTVKRTVMFDDGHARELEYSIRLYALHELGKLLHDRGFKVVEVTGHPAHRGVYFGAESPRIIILAERD